jgi:hypothetical protein
LRRTQPPRTLSGILVRCDGVSNVTDENPEHPLKTERSRFETEEGTVKVVKREQCENANDFRQFWTFIAALPANDTDGYWDLDMTKSLAFQKAKTGKPVMQDGDSKT